MTSFSKTAIVYNQPNKIIGLPEYYYRARTCDTNLTSNTPASQYQRLKLIQNTVRVYASLYVSNLGPLEAYRQPTNATYGVCWNQMSDRPVPSVQKSVIPTGTNCALNRRHTSVTSSRPGCQAPGGVGCDIKHNSYDRYLNRLKGKGPLRRGVIPPTFGALYMAEKLPRPILLMDVIVLLEHHNKIYNKTFKFIIILIGNLIPQPIMCLMLMIMSMLYKLEILSIQKQLFSLLITGFTL